MSDTSNPSLPDAVRRFGAPRQKVPPFTRFKGTSAWHKDRRRARVRPVPRHGEAGQPSPGKTKRLIR